MTDEEFDQLCRAYGFLDEIESGLNADQEISDDELLMLEVLRADLMPEFRDVPANQEEFEAFLHKLFRRNTHWNHRLQEAFVNFYEEADQGNAAIARSIAEAFLEECPSAWYRSHMAAASDQ